MVPRYIKIADHGWKELKYSLLSQPLFKFQLHLDLRELESRSLIKQVQDFYHTRSSYSHTHNMLADSGTETMMMMMMMMIQGLLASVINPINGLSHQIFIKHHYVLSIIARARDLLANEVHKSSIPEGVHILEAVTNQRKIIIHFKL